MAVGPDAIVRACALARSVELVEPDVPVALITTRSADVPAGYFATRLGFDEPEPFTGGQRYLNKLVHPFQLSPFRRTLFLDDDTLLIRPISDLVDNEFRGHMVALNGIRQAPDAGWIGNNLLRPAETCEALGREWIYNLAGGGHYYFEQADGLDEFLSSAIDFAIDPTSAYADVGGRGRSQLADEIAFLYAINAQGLDIPTLPDFIDGLSFDRAGTITVDVEQGRYEFPDRPWGEQIDQVRLLHFYSRAKRALPYVREIHRLTGLRQSFDAGARGVARRARHAIRLRTRRVRQLTRSR